MHPDERTTCYTHQGWAADCEPQHDGTTAGQVLAGLREADRIRYGQGRTVEDEAAPGR